MVLVVVLVAARTHNALVGYKAPLSGGYKLQRVVEPHPCAKVIVFFVCAKGGAYFLAVARVGVVYRFAIYEYFPRQVEVVVVQARNALIEVLDSIAGIVIRVVGTTYVFVVKQGGSTTVFYSAEAVGGWLVGITQHIYRCALDDLTSGDVMPPMPQFTDWGERDWGWARVKIVLKIHLLDHIFLLRKIIIHQKKLLTLWQKTYHLDCNEKTYIFSLSKDQVK